MRIFYVYRLRLETSDVPFYIGKGTGKRFDVHFYPSSLKKKSHKNHIILKAMADGIPVLKEIIEQGLSESDALGLERKMIAHYGRADIGTGILANHTDGGEGTSGCVHVRGERYRENVRNSRIGKKASAKSRETMSCKNWDRNPELWVKADVMYGIFKDLSVKTSYFLGKASGYKPSKVSRMTEKFKGGWNPLESDDWLKWRQAMATSALNTFSLAEACLPV